MKLKKHQLWDDNGEENTPENVINAIIDDFLPDIIAYYESKEGQEAFAKWKSERLQKMQQNNSEVKKVANA